MNASGISHISYALAGASNTLIDNINPLMLIFTVDCVNLGGADGRELIIIVTRVY